MNRTERRSWDRYVAEARAVRSEIDLGDGDVLVVQVPSADRVNQLNDAMQDPRLQADIWAQLEAVLGPEDAGRLRTVAADAPVTALTKLFQDILSDLGLSDAGNSPASSS